MSKDERNHPAFEYGTDKQFLNWVSYQPSVIDEEFNQHEDNEGNPRNIPCHVRRINRGAAMAHKPPFSAVAMTDRQHKIQSSREGEVKVLRLLKVGGKLVNIQFTPEEAALWFESAADETVKNWIEYRKNKRK